MMKGTEGPNRFGNVPIYDEDSPRNDEFLGSVLKIGIPILGILLLIILSSPKVFINTASPLREKIAHITSSLLGNKTTSSQFRREQGTSGSQSKVKKQIIYIDGEINYKKALQCLYRELTYYNGIYDQPAIWRGIQSPWKEITYKNGLVFVAFEGTYIEGGRQKYILLSATLHVISMNKPCNLSYNSYEPSVTDSDANINKKSDTTSSSAQKRSKKGKTALFESNIPLYYLREAPLSAKQAGRF